LQGYVYKAETSEVDFVAIKKSRSSLKIKRANLAYEGKILQILEGCPRVVDVLGYRRVEHFEYLAVTLEGPSLNTIAKDKRLSGHTIVVVASQMVREASRRETVIKPIPARSARLPSR
jgi:predicted Ser/Thr protein kinase